MNVMVFDTKVCLFAGSGVGGGGQLSLSALSILCSPQRQQGKCRLGTVSTAGLKPLAQQTVQNSSF